MKILHLIIIISLVFFACPETYASSSHSTDAVDWSGARWLKATDTPAYEGSISTTIDMDISVVSGNPSVIFSWTADRAYFQWQIITDAPGGPVLRRCVLTYTDDPPYEDTPLSGFSREDIVGKWMHLCIKASGRDVTTYLGDKKVDTYTCPRQVLVGKAGIRVEPGGEILFDNFEMKQSGTNGVSRTLISEDFNANNSMYFRDAHIVDGACLVKASTTANFLSTMDDCNPTFYRYFDVKKTVAEATMYTSALGVYDVWINDQRVGVNNPDGTVTYDEMKQGWTDYNKRVTYSAYDVTALCKDGENSIGALVTPGWLSSRISRGLYKWPLSLAFIAKLEIKYTDGTREVIVTDDSWYTEKYSPVLKSDIYDGECFDARRDFPWTYKVSAMPCKPELYDYPGEIVAQQGPPVRAVKGAILQPVSTVVYSQVLPTSDYGEIIVEYSTSSNTPLTLKVGETAIIDFGQNCTGVPMITLKGKRGTHMHVRFGEMLNDTGEKSRGNDGPAGSLYTANLRAARAEVHYAVRGEDKAETYSPSTSFFGYRYCSIKADDEIMIESIVTVPWSSSFEVTGSVETDNEDVNRLFQNILWSQLSNFLSVPTDCPQRDERLGWTADAQLFSTMAMYNANVSDFYRKWLCDMRDSQREDGAYSDVSPLSLVNYGTAGWADAGIVVPWQIYQMTGDKEAMAEHYASMERYMGWLSTLKEDGLDYPGAYTTYGDLFSPHPAERRFVSQAYYYYDACLMSKMSSVLSSGSNDSFYKQAQHYSLLAQDIKKEMQARYFNGHGLAEPTQSSCVISLWFGLYADEAQRQGLVDSLVRLIKEGGYKLDTGFISTTFILQTLSDYGYDNVAYDLLTQHDYPSWLYMVDNGATTMWENWYCYRPESGFCSVQQNSFNHFALGSFGSWMYSHMAGISPCEEKPGFSKVIFSPSIDTREECPESRKVGRAKAAIRVADCLISAEWTLDSDGMLRYDINVPYGVDAEVRLPVPSPEVKVYESGVEIQHSQNIMSLGFSGGRMVYSVMPGEYHFSVRLRGASVDSPFTTDFKIWPNPAAEKLYISCDEEVLDVTISAVSGRTESVPYTTRSSIDVSSLQPGFYIVTVTTQSGKRAEKFIKL